MKAMEGGPCPVLKVRATHAQTPFKGHLTAQGRWREAGMLCRRRRQQLWGREGAGGTGQGMAVGYKMAGCIPEDFWPKKWAGFSHRLEG